MFPFYGFTLIILGILAWYWCTKDLEKSYPDKTRIGQWLADLDYFEDEYLPNSRTFSKEATVACKILLDSLRKNVKNLSDNQMILGLSKGVAMANNGHTTIHLSGMEKIPLRFYWFSDGLYVIKTDKPSSKYLGSKVLEINSMDLNKVFEKMKPYLSGIDSFKKFIASNYLASPEILNGLDISKKDNVTLSLLKDQDTLKVTFEIKNMPNSTYEYETWSDLYPDNVADNPWYHLLNKNDQLPRYLHDMQKGVSHAFMDSTETAYFNINALWYKCKDFEGEIQSFLDTLKVKSDYDVIVDLRYYTGGNFMIPTKLATAIPEIIDNQKKI